MSRVRHVLSLESVINGKLHRELEYTFYAKLKDLSQLDNAYEIEEHEQWQIPIETEQSFKMRLRLINNRRATYATKNRKPGVLGFDEVEDDMSPDMFNQFKLVAINGYKKTRYNFKIPNSPLKWEVDVFLDRTGAKHPWVKIDLEVNDPNDAIPEFPLEIEQLIIDNGPKQTMEEKRFVRSLWDNEWSRLDPIRVEKQNDE